MKRLISVLLSIALIFSLAACSSGESVPEESAPDVEVNSEIVDEIRDRGYIVVGCKTDVPGLGLLEGDTWSGIEVELAYEIAGKIFDTDSNGAKTDNLVHFVGVTVADREQMLEDGEIDLMLATYTITEERAQRFCLSESYYTDYIGLMVLNYGYDNDSLSNPGIHSIADLDGKLIGVPRNATTRDAFIDYSSTMSTVTVTPRFVEYDSYETLYTALYNGDIDVMSVDVSILQGYVDEGTVILSDRFGAQRYGAAVLPENAPLIDIVNEVI